MLNGHVKVTKVEACRVQLPLQHLQPVAVINYLSQVTSGTAALRGLVITLSVTKLRMTHVFCPCHPYATLDSCSTWFVQGSSKVLESKQDLPCSEIKGRSGMGVSS